MNTGLLVTTFTVGLLLFTIERDRQTDLAKSDRYTVHAIQTTDRALDRKRWTYRDRQIKTPDIYRHTVYSRYRFRQIKIKMQTGRERQIESDRQRLRQKEIQTERERQSESDRQRLTT